MPSKPGAAPRQRRAIATRAQILRGGATAIIKHGYEGATLAAIQKETKVSNGAFYFHFPTREALALAVLEEYTQFVRGIAEASRQTTAIESLIDASFVFAKAIRTRPVVQAGIVLSTERSSLPAGEVKDAYVVWSEQVTASLIAAESEGDLRREVVVEEVSRFFVAAFTGIQLASSVLTRRKDLTERVRSAWMILLPALVIESRQRPLQEAVEARANPESKRG